MAFCRSKKKAITGNTYQILIFINPSLFDFLGINSEIFFAPVVPLAERCCSIARRRQWLCCIILVGLVTNAWLNQRVYRRRSTDAPTLVHERVENDGSRCARRGQVPVPQAHEFRRAHAYRARRGTYPRLPDAQASAPDAPRC